MSIQQLNTQEVAHVAGGATLGLDLGGGNAVAATLNLSTLLTSVLGLVDQLLSAVTTRAAGLPLVGTVLGLLSGLGA